MKSMDLINEQFLHTCQFVVHKCKEGGQLYLNPKIPDTSEFSSPDLDNQDVAEKLINHIDTAKMQDFIDGLGKFATRYAYSSTATKATKWILKKFKKVKKGSRKNKVYLRGSCYEINWCFLPLKVKRDDITIKTIKEPKTGQNSIVVTIAGSSGDEENVILGAHLDTTANRDPGEMTGDKPAPG